MSKSMKSLMESWDKFVKEEEQPETLEAGGHWQHEGLPRHLSWQQEQLKKSGRLPEWFVELPPLSRWMVLSGTYDLDHYADHEFRVKMLPDPGEAAYPDRIKVSEKARNHGLPSGNLESVDKEFSVLLRKDGGMDMHRGGGAGVSWHRDGLLSSSTPEQAASYLAKY